MKPLVLALALPVLLTGCAAYVGDAGPGYPGYYDGGYAYGGPAVDVGFYSSGSGGYYNRGGGYHHYDSGYHHNGGSSAVAYHGASRSNGTHVASVSHSGGGRSGGASHSASVSSGGGHEGGGHR